MLKPLRILAIETSSRTGSVALGQADVCVREDSVESARRHASGLMPAIASSLQSVGWTPADLTQIYISIGPGSFTGLRVAVAIARVFAQTHGCQLIAVPTVDVIAANAPDNVRELLVALDAKRGEIFGAHFSRTSAGALQRVEGPALLFPADLLARCPRPVHIIGEGIDYHRPTLLPAADPGVIELDRALWTPRAKSVLSLGWQLAQAGQFTPLEQLLPTYIRLAEAEEVWLKKHGLPL